MPHDLAVFIAAFLTALFIASIWFAFDDQFIATWKVMYPRGFGNNVTETTKPKRPS